MRDGTELPAGWAETTLGETLPIVYGKGLVESARDSSGDVPVYGSSGQVGVHNQALTTQATLIVGRKGSVGAVHYSSMPCWPIDTTYYVEETPGRELRFFLYLLKHLNLGQLDKSTAIPGLSRDDYNSVRIPLPPLAEQRRIVAAIEEQFTRLDAGVAALRRARAALKRYRAAVLKAAVEGRLTADWRAAHLDVEPASALLRRILAERRARWEAEQRAKGKDPAEARYDEPAAPDTAALPGLPEGWVWATVEQLLVESLCNGISVKGSDSPPGTPALKLSAMSDSGFNYASRRFINISRDDQESLAIRAGDFFVARGNGSLHLVGRGTLAQDPDELIVFPDTMIRVRVGWLGAFVSTIWPTSFVRGQIERTARTTAGIYKISQGDLNTFVLPLPCVAEQEQIVAEVERRLSVVGELETAVAANLKRAERLRQAILERAFSGRLVEQDAGDEPAGELLERVRRAREKGGKDEIREEIVEQGGLWE